MYYKTMTKMSQYFEFVSVFCLNILISWTYRHMICHAEVKNQV